MHLFVGPLFSPERQSPTAEYSTLQFVQGVLGAVFSILLLRCVLDRVAFRPFARFALTGKKHGKVAKPSKISKFTESLWKLLVYSFLESFAYYALHDKRWLWDTTDYWRSWPHQPQSQRVQQLYFLQTGFYIASLYMLLFWETRRSDFSVMLIHHLTALILIAASYYCGYLRVGSVVLLLHDISDILLEAAKVANYAGLQLLSTAAFAAMMLSWFGLRLVIFPRYIIWSCYQESGEVLGYQVKYYWPFISLLLLLLVMHVYWFALIVKVAMGMLVKGLEDVREKDDDD